MLDCILINSDEVNKLSWERGNWLNICVKWESFCDNWFSKILFLLTTNNLQCSKAHQSVFSSKSVRHPSTQHRAKSCSRQETHLYKAADRTSITNQVPLRIDCPAKQFHIKFKVLTLDELFVLRCIEVICEHVLCEYVVWGFQYGTAAFRLRYVSPLFYWNWL